MTSNVRVVMTIDLDYDVTGQTIINAVKRLAGQDFHEDLLIIDDLTYRMVGQRSTKRAENLVISTHVNDEGSFLVPLGRYTYITVASYSWPGGSIATDKPEQVVEAVRKFRDDLKSELEQS